MKVKFFDCNPEIFKGQMQRFIETCAKNNPYAEMNKDQILIILQVICDTVFSLTLSINKKS
jgi:hypothetical protein